MNKNSSAIPYQISDRNSSLNKIKLISNQNFNSKGKYKSKYNTLYCNSHKILKKENDSTENNKYYFNERENSIETSRI